MFTTASVAIVACSVSRMDREDDICHHCGNEGLDYEELSPVGEEEWDLEQEASCPNCGKRWKDVFVLSGQHEMSKKRKKPIPKAPASGPHGGHDLD